MRIDHAVASPQLAGSVRECRYSHAERENGVSDLSMVIAPGVSPDLAGPGTLGAPCLESAGTECEWYGSSGLVARPTNTKLLSGCTKPFVVGRLEPI
jgi:hypothetical protein